MAFLKLLFLGQVHEFTNQGDSQTRNILSEITFTFYRESKIHNFIMMPVQCGICVFSLTVKVSPVGVKTI